MSLKIQYADQSGNIVENKASELQGPDEEAHESIQPQIRLGNQHLELKIVDGQSQLIDRSKPIRVNAEDIADRPEGSVLSTARDNFGPTTDVRDNTVVEVDGYEMTARVAAGLGYLRRNPDGSYSDINRLGQQGGGDKKTSSAAVDNEQYSHLSSKTNDYDDDLDSEDLPQNGEGQAHQQAQLMDSETEAEIESLYQKAGDSMAEYFAVAMIKDPYDANAQRELAEHLGMDQESFSETVQRLYGKFVDQANKYVESKYAGKVTPEELWDWANENLPAKSLERIKQAHWRGDLSGYDALVRDYLANTKPVRLPQGAKVRRTESGEELVELPGKPEVSMRVAVLLGWL